MHKQIRKRILAGVTSLALAGTAVPAALADAFRAWAAGAPAMTLTEFGSLTAALAADDQPQTYFDTLTLTVGADSAVTDDGRAVALSAAVKRAGGDLLVPADFLAQSIGAKVEQPAADGRTAIVGDGLRVGLRVGSASIAAQGEEIHAAADVQLHGNTVLVPLDAVAQTLGYTVTETASGAELRHAFQTARLIVKAAGSLAPTGAKAVVEGYHDLHVLQYDTPTEAYAAYLTYQDADGVQYAEPSVYCETTSDKACDSAAAIEQSAAVLAQKLEDADAAETPAHYSWGAQTIGVDTFQAVLAEQEPLPEIRVAVIDTGIDYAHPWFAGRIASGGTNFSQTSDQAGQDDHGHGTHVSGTILDLCSDNVKILPIKALSANGSGALEAVYCAMEYANAQDVAVVNMSLGQNGCSPLMEEAIREGTQKGIVYCVSAGNDTINAQLQAPACVTEAITVSAIDTNHALCDFSNYGDCIDFAAPGKDIVSAQLGGETVSFSGTSMAAPHVSACCALLKTYNPALTAKQVEEVLTDNAVDLGAPGFDKCYGNGAVNMHFTEVQAGGCPMPVAEVSAEDNGSMRVTLTAQAGASVYYTTDGTVPTRENGQLYTAPLVLTHSTRLMAVACMADGATSRCVTRDIVIDEQDVTDAWVAQDGVVTQYRGVLQTVVVPGTIGGVAVTAIGASAFRDNTTVEKVVLPDSVTTIGDYAFAGCTSLEACTASGVTQIGAYAFADDRSLAGMELTEMTQAGAYAFSGTGLRSFGGSRLTAVSEGMFRNCTALERVSCYFATEIGDRAFENCTALATLNVKFEKMTRIGKLAFSGCALSFSADLTALTTLAPYAFANAGVCEITLSEQIATLPEGCFLLAESLRMLTAPGVTELAPFALAVGFSQEMNPTLELCWDKLTRLGEHCLEGCTLDDDLTLSALRTLEPDGLYNAKGYRLELPQVTEVPTHGLYYGTFESVALPQVKSLAPESVNCISLLVLGDSCTDIAEDAIGSPQMIICANETSAAYQFAVTNEYACEKLPYLQERDAQSVTCDRYAPCTISVLAGGFGLSYQWYRTQTGSSADGTPIDGAVQYRFALPTAESGTFRYYCVVHDSASDSDLVSGVFTVEVAPETTEEIVPETPVDIDGVTQAVTKSLLFAPQTDGNYLLEVVAPIAQAPTVTITALETAQTFAAGTSFRAVAGNHYLICVMYEKAGNACRVTLRDAIGGDLPLIMQTAEAPTGLVYSYTGEPITPALSLQMNGRALQPGVDFDCVYYCNTDCGTGYQYCYGKGMYTGAVCVPFAIRDSLTLNTPKDAVLRETGSGSYTFVPETTGRYTFSCMPTADTDYSFYIFSSRGEITTADGETVLSSAVYETNTGYFCVSARLTAGVPYLCTAALQNGTPQRCSVRVTDESVAPLLPETTKITTDESLVFTGAALTPTSVVVSVNDRVLTEGKDYSLLYQNNVIPGKMSVYVFGIGDYCGVILDQSVCILIDDFTKVEKTVKVGQTLSATLAPNTPAIYSFSPQEAGTCYLHIRQLSSVVTQVYQKQADGTTSLINQAQFGGLRFAAQPGETYDLVLFWYGDTASRLPFTLQYALDDDNAVVTASDCVYSGEQAEPEITVTYLGRTLRRDADYTVEFSSDRLTCGTQCVSIKGKNKYEGTVNAEYQIYIPLSTQKEEAVLGRNQVSIAKPNGVQTFTFTPQKSREYAILSTEKRSNLLMLTDEAGAPVDRLGPSCGNDDNFLVAYLEAGKTYCITARFSVSDQTGSWSFLLRADFRFLSQLDVSYSETVEWTGETVQPTVTIRDGDKVLEKGTDYIDTGVSGGIDCGEGSVCLVGKGKYVGSLTLPFTVVRAPAANARIAVLTAEQSTTCSTLTHDNAVLYRFTAETSDTFHMELDTGLAVALYDETLKFLRRPEPIKPFWELPVIQWRMEAGETVILQVTRAETVDDLYPSFPLLITQGAIAETKMFAGESNDYDMEYNMVTQQTKLCHYRGDYTDEIVVPDVLFTGNITEIGTQAFFTTQNTTKIYLPLFLQRIDEKGIMCDKLREIRIPYGCELMAHSVGYSTFDKPIVGFTIYGYLGDFSQTYAQENGFRFVPLNPAVEDWERFTDPDAPVAYVLGDVNNDAVVNVTDAIFILRDYARTLLGADSLLTVPQQKAADLNHDGKCDVKDAVLVLKIYAQSLLK